MSVSFLPDGVVAEKKSLPFENWKGTPVQPVQHWPASRSGALLIGGVHPSTHVVDDIQRIASALKPAID